MDNKKLKVYLDNCCYNRPFDESKNIEIELETIAKLAVQRLIKMGQIDLQWSYILSYENYNNPKKINKANIAKWKDIAIDNILENENILLNAEKYEKLGIKQYDALHIACAVESKCDYFLTTDKGILKKHITDIRTINPIDFMREVFNHD